jgi:hypothetical protein
MECPQQKHTLCRWAADILAFEMIDDPIDRERIEREALDVVLAYYAGTAPLQAALDAIVAVSSLPVPEGDRADDSDDANDAFLGVDLAALPPEEQARADALTRAIQEHFRDTA